MDCLKIHWQQNKGHLCSSKVNCINILGNVYIYLSFSKLNKLDSSNISLKLHFHSSAAISPTKVVAPEEHRPNPTGSLILSTKHMQHSGISEHIFVGYLNEDIWDEHACL